MSRGANDRGSAGEGDTFVVFLPRPICSRGLASSRLTASVGWVRKSIWVKYLREWGQRDERFAQGGARCGWRGGWRGVVAAGFVSGGATEVRALGEVALQRLSKQGAHRWWGVRRLQGGPDPLRACQGPQRRRNHAYLAGELLHVLADAGQRHRRRCGDPERRAALAPDPDPTRRQLQAGSSGQRRPGKAARGGRRQGVPLRASRALAGGGAGLLRHTRRGGALHKHKGDRRRRGDRRQGYRTLRGGNAGGGRDP